MGKNNSILSIENNELVVQALSSFREIFVRNRQDFYLANISKGRYALANIAGEMNFMPNVSKYVLEASVVIGGLLLATSQFMLQDAKHAFATLAVFLAAASRIAPALLRLQQGLLQVRTSSGGAMPALDLYDDLSNSAPHKQGEIQGLDLIHEGFEAVINFDEVCFKYPGKDSNVLTNISFNVSPGEILAIVGPSGAGKTTLVDLMIGLIPPTSGYVEVSGIEPSQAIITYPGAISYVPQDISIINDTVEGNICLGYEKNTSNVNWISEVISLAKLDEVISNLNDGINTHVGERGTKLSGGQRQRLGIARALFTNPKLIILDEATSALDAETENLVSNSINNLRGKVTVVLIAHRLATVRTADKVCYIEDGIIKGFGNFEEVRSQVPNFDKQANLLGLK